MHYGPDDKFLFKSVYKYSAGGRLDQELHLNGKDALVNKLVYTYDANGRQTGYGESRYTMCDPLGIPLGTRPPRQQRAFLIRAFCLSSRRVALLRVALVCIALSDARRLVSK